jgi:hypothetical protein
MREMHPLDGIRRYLTQKYHWTAKMCKNIDWYSHCTAINKSPKTQHSFLHKFIIKWLSFNKRQHEHEQAPTDQCLLCNTSQESHSHFLKCNDNPVKVKWLMCNLWKTFNKHKVDPILRELIYQGLKFALSSKTGKNHMRINNYRRQPLDTKHYMMPKAVSDGNNFGLAGLQMNGISIKDDILKTWTLLIKSQLENQSGYEQ